MSDVIVAGIVNCRTGEIIETVTRATEKTALRLKVRDELNKEHGKDAFYAFELDTALGFSLSYLRKLMKSDEPALTLEVQLLNARYKVHQTTQQLARLEDEVTAGESAYEKCCELFENGSSELDFVQSGLEDELTERRDSVSDCKSDLARYKKSVTEFEARINQQKEK